MLPLIFTLMHIFIL